MIEGEILCLVALFYLLFLCYMIALCKGGVGDNG